MYPEPSPDRPSALQRRIEALEAAVHRLGDDRAHLQTDLNALARMMDAQAVVIKKLQEQVQKLRWEE